jgi:outer membrane biosynthesis protein TonB
MMFRSIRENWAIDGPTVVVAAVLLAQAPACATTPHPVALPARCTEKSTAAKAPPSAAVPGEGETALNAKRWMYATYFNRLKQKVAENWKPAEEYQRRDPDGSLYGQKVLTTLLRVVVRSDGSLDAVNIDSSSGLDFLDDLAVEAFEKA